MGMAADHFCRDRLDDRAKVESLLFLRHAGVKYNLQEEIAQFVLQVRQIMTRDGVGDLISFLDRIGSDGREILLNIPGATGLRRAQRCHDLNESAYVARGLHGSKLAS